MKKPFSADEEETEKNAKTLSEALGGKVIEENAGSESVSIDEVTGEKES